MKKLILIFFVLLSACSGGGDDEIFSDPTQIAVDAENDRLFVFQRRGEILSFTASTMASLIEEQPLVGEDLNSDIQDVMPFVTTQAVALASGTDTLLYVLGGQQDSNDNVVFNSLRVFTTDGVTISSADISPIALSDDDDLTDDTEHVYGGMIVDPDSSRLYIVDTTVAKLLVLDALTGTSVVDPVALAGRPQGISLADGHLFICNTSTVEAEQVVTVVDTSDFSQTQIDFDLPCNLIAAAGDDTAIMALINRSDAQEVLIQSVDTTTFASATSIVAGTDGFTSGSLLSGEGISSSISGLALIQDSDGTFLGYAANTDGNITFMTAPSDLAEYTAQTITTAGTGLTDGEIFLSADLDQVFFVGTEGSVVHVELGADVAGLED